MLEFSSKSREDVRSLVVMLRLSLGGVGATATGLLERPEPSLWADCASILSSTRSSGTAQRAVEVVGARCRAAWKVTAPLRATTYPKMCARPDPKQVMLKGGDADVVATCWMFTDSPCDEVPYRCNTSTYSY